MPTPRPEPLPASARPLGETPLEDTPCYPCAHLDTVRRLRGVQDAPIVVYPRCAHGYLAVPWLGDRCHAYAPQAHLLARGT